MIAGLLMPKGWSPVKTYTGWAAQLVERERQRDLLVWVPCATCWGQGRIIEQGGAGGAAGGDLAHLCGTCLGIGQVESVPKTRQVLLGG